MKNFAFPYFSRDIAEFWRRWHISLSTWFRDYLYIPLGGSRGSKWMQIRNVFIIFIVSGFWHGANWTFIVWGALNAVYFLPLLLAKKNRSNLDVIAEGRLIPGIREFSGMAITFGLTLLAWVFFRAQNLGHAFSYLGEIFSSSFLTIPAAKSFTVLNLLMIPCIFLLFFVEWMGRKTEYGLEKFGLNWPRPLRWAFYFGIIFTLFVFAGTEQEFIYFQF